MIDHFAFANEKNRFCTLANQLFSPVVHIIKGPKFNQVNMRAAPIAQRIRTDNFMWMGSSQDDEDDDKKKKI